MSDLHWQLRTQGDDATRYVSSDDHVIATSPLPGLIHLLGPVVHDDDIQGSGPRRDVLALCEMGDWATLYKWFIEPSDTRHRLGQA